MRGSFSRIRLSSLNVASVAAVCLAVVTGCSNESGTARAADEVRISDFNKPTVPVAIQERPSQELISDIQKNVSAWEDGKPYDFNPLAARVVKLLEAGLDQDSAGLGAEFAHICEMAGSYDAAKSLYAAIQKAANKSDNPRLVFQAREIASAGLTRLSALGSTPKLEANVFGGGKFDLAQYKGKVVLIDFWATWCKPCMQELPNVKNVYNQFHNQGFEVVGITLDEEKETLARFLDKERLPWPTLFDEDPDKQGWKMPLAKQFGIESIPAMYLVDKSGKIVSISAHGPELEAQVKKLLAEKQ